MKIDSELLKGSTSFLILSLLAEEPMYGYRIAREIQARTGGRFLFKEGTLYPMLHKLERERVIEARWTREGSGRRKKVYSITARGREILSTKREAWGVFVGSINAVLVPKSA